MLQNNAIVKRAVDEIMLQQKEILIVKDKTHENIQDEVNEYDMYEINKINLDEKKDVSELVQSQLVHSLTYVLPSSVRD